MRLGLAILVLLSVFISGCMVGFASPPTSSAPGLIGGEASTAADRVGPGTTEIDKRSTDGRPGLPPRQNPWGHRDVTVTLEPGDVSDDRYEPLLRAAIDYWNGPGREYTKSDVRFVFSTGPQTGVDVVVRVIRSVSCNGRSAAVGCAPVVSPGDRIDGPIVVTVEAGYTDASTLAIMKHELGHIVGIGHDEPPVEVMSTNRTLVRLDENELSGQESS